MDDEDKMDNGGRARGCVRVVGVAALVGSGEARGVGGEKSVANLSNAASS